MFYKSIVHQVDQRTASLLALSLLVVIHCSWFTVENFLADKYVRFLLTPYLVVIWAANGIWQKILVKNSSASDPPVVPGDVQDFVLAILIIASITFVARLGLVIYRVVKNRPLSSRSPVSTISDSIS